MKKVRNRILIFVLVAFVGVQFIPANVNQQTLISEVDITYVYEIPDGVIKVLQTSCYDCHSNNTIYPWYSNIQPFRVIMDSHVRKGKEELNFSEFGTYSDRRKKNKLKSIKSQIQTGKMPLPSYKALHQDAKLSERDMDVVVSYFNRLEKMIQ